VRKGRLQLGRAERPVRQEQMEHPVRTVPLAQPEQKELQERMLPRKPLVQTVQKQPGQQVHQELPVHLERLGRLGRQASAGHRHWWPQR